MKRKEKKRKILSGKTCESTIFSIVFIVVFMMVSNQFLYVFGYTSPDPIPTTWDQKIDGEYISTPFGMKRSSLFQDSGSGSLFYESIAIDVYQSNSKAHYEVVLERYDTTTYTYMGGGHFEIEDGKAMIEFHPYSCSNGFDYGESCVSNSDCLSNGSYHTIKFDDKSLFYKVKLYFDLYLKEA